MLLVLNFFLWKNVVFVFMYVSLDEYGEMFIYDLFDYVIILFYNVSEFIVEMYRIFVSILFWVFDKMGF